MPFCTTCEQEKPTSAFTKSKYSKSGYQYYCRECRRVRDQKKRAMLSPEELNQLREKERVKASARRAYHRSIGSPIKKRERVPYSVYKLTAAYRARRMCSSARSRAHKYDEPCDIDPKWIKSILEKGRCQRSGVKFELGYDGDTQRNPFGPSIDRIDNKKGYTKENCQIVCNMYNGGKGQHTDQQFIDFCRAVTKFNSGDMIGIE